MPRLFRETHIDFVGRRKFGFYLSAGLILLGIGSLIIQGGLRYGIDFTGGHLIQIQFREPLTTEMLRNSLNKIGYQRAEIQRLGAGREFLIRVPPTASEETEGGFASRVVAVLEEERPDNPVEVVREETVGPRIGQELQRNALIAIILGMIGILGYVAIRFDFRFGIGAVIALIHDAFVVLGIFNIMGRELSITAVAGFLTLIGYSVNDSIVVSDRIRENLKLYRGEDFEYIVNRGINDTLSRTIITGLTTFFVALILFLVGIQAIQDFAFIMILGIIIGTYSSIFIVASLVVEWEQRYPLRRRR